MYLALEGKEGIVTAEDYAGTAVLAAYTYVPSLKWGIVAKIPIKEINQPYYKAVYTALIIAILLITISILLFVRISDPLVKSLLESEDTYQMLFESINDSVFISEISTVGKISKFIKTNDIASKWLGYSHAELLSKTAFDISTDKAKNKINAITKELLEKKHAIFETEYITKDGRIIPVEVSSKLTNFHNKTIIHSIVRDIADRKNTEQAIQEKTDVIEAQNEEYSQMNEELSQTNMELQFAKERAEESEARFRSIIENTEAGYFYIDNEGIFQKVNRAWLNLYKYDSFDEVIGKHFIQVQQLEDIEAAKQFVEGIKKGIPEYMNGNFSRLCKDKTVGYHSFSARTVYQGNLILGIEGFIIDITKQKESEIELIQSRETLEKNEKKYRSLFTSLQEGVYLHEIVYNENGIAVNYRITDANPISEKYLNITSEFAIDKLATDLYGIPEAPFLEIYAKVAETGEPYSFQQYFEPMKKHFLISVFSPAKGQFATAFLDITQSINYENEIIIAKDKAEESDRLKTAFLQNMSHEIRTPMNAIMGFSELLLKNYDNKDKLEKFSTIINQRCNDLLDIINEILDISKIESGQLPIKIEECNLASLFAELEFFFSEYQKRIKKQHIKLNIQTVCEPADNIIITDKVKLKQIYINLISNALKFTEKGNIDLGCKYDSHNNLIFYVSDTGIGIPVEKQNKIFERFVQLNNDTNQASGGTGLGLSIVKGLVNLLGGEIWLDSKVGKGTIFYFTVPFKRLKSVPKKQHFDEEIREFNFPDKTILIVEDDLYNSEYIKEILFETGLTILHTISGKEAIKEAAEHSPDLILMDIHLPDITGYEAIYKIKENNPKSRIIAQTAYAAQEDYVKAIESGCVDYISKPLNRNHLINLISKYLRAI
jgi:PAS domain S-box-containing protein